MSGNKSSQRNKAAPALIREAIGARFRSERRRLGLTQAQLGDELGVIALSIANYEHGESSPPADLLHRFHKLGGDVAFVVAGANSLDQADHRDRFAVAFRLVRNHRPLRSYNLRDDELLALVWYVFDILGESTGEGEVDVRDVSELLQAATTGS